MTFTVSYVFWDEPTPRDVHTRTVQAADAEQAALVAMAELPDDRISVTGVTERDGQ